VVVLEDAVGRITCHRRFQPHLHRHTTTSLVFEHITIAHVALIHNSLQQIKHIHITIPTTIHTYQSHLPINMPVPMHSTSEKSTSTPVTAQTSSTTGNTSTTSAASAMHTEKTEHEKEMERQYEERMEEEYAKREGGA
jgi:hypothetical protein